MKNNRLFQWASALVAVLFLASCDSFVDGFEDDPTRPLDVTMDLMLSSSELFTVYTQSDDIARYTAVVMQQVTGADRQMLAVNRYNIQRGDFDQVWSGSAYSGAMKGLKNIIAVADAQGSPHYAGVAKVLLAVNLGVLTDAFGDIPYTEAFQGDANLKPKYDSQEEIYQTIQMLLTDAIEDLSAEASVSSPSVDDFIYDGNLDLWTKLAWGLKARYTLHLSKVAGYDAQEVLDLLGNSFAASSESAEITFETAQEQSNLWNRFLVNRADYIRFEGKMFDMMEADMDPRLTIYRPFEEVKEDGVVTGTVDVPEEGFYSSPTSPIAFMTYEELKFIEAEAYLSLNMVTEAEMAFQEAIGSHMAKVGVDEADADAYLMAHGTLNSGTELQQVMEAKYVALFTHPESWVDYRRTGYPMLTPPDNSELPSGKIPRRFPYAESEYLYNAVNVPDLNKEDGLLQRMWWDVN
ncbi:SusD/RagB family nutrient-binding outer membrane lipoprotein [Persicobacter sp. CCB-QB2]|uniref:SusD/RagB family nutrient-binding outer membrane lipoprotein n=1 Tax=Persicobacter sp. CCB-QB2 TaxID=1561025 RepID=UPI0006A983FF|nr:SusD/RagB family nutrient-binding outer membrane lipoprotein [Persicobacter sp. CCB-QB2]